MSLAQLLPAALLLIALALQALFPSRRLVVLAVAASLSALVTAVMGTASAAELLAEVPWDVIVILITLGLLTELIAATHVFGLLALHATRWSRARPRTLLLLFSVGMYAVSGLVNNLTALMLVVPVLLILFKLLGVGQRYVSWTLSLVLVSCNLGGAATPIGDFPAILLLGRGAMTFNEYLVRAAPVTLVALLLVIAATMLLARPAPAREQHPVAQRLTLATLDALYRNLGVKPRRLVPPVAILLAMLVAWVTIPRSTGVTAELIAWLGAAVALLLAGARGEKALRTRVDMEATLFLLALFIMVGAVRKSGLFTDVAVWLQGLPVPPSAQLGVFLVAGGVLTGLFSAGPSMAALLEVAEQLARTHPPHAVYVGLALSVCAGSSLFLTAATAGPLAQALTERAGLQRADGQPIRFGFAEFLPAGLLSYVIIQTVAVVWTLWAVT